MRTHIQNYIAMKLDDPYHKTLFIGVFQIIDWISNRSDFGFIPERGKKLFLGALMTKVPFAVDKSIFQKKTHILPLSSQVSTSFVSKHDKECSKPHCLFNINPLRKSCCKNVFFFKYLQMVFYES